MLAPTLTAEPPCRGRSAGKAAEGERGQGAGPSAVHVETTHVFAYLFTRSQPTALRTPWEASHPGALVQCGTQIFLH